MYWAGSEWCICALLNGMIRPDTIRNIECFTSTLINSIAFYQHVIKRDLEQEVIKQVMLCESFPRMPVPHGRIEKLE